MAIESPTLVESLSERARANYSTGALIDKERFTSREYIALENERLWSRTWNVVCRESEVRNVGDYYECTVAGESLLVIRERPGQLRAISNVCRHRGTHLKSGSGTTKELRCPFHGWTYALDGTLREITRDWDFPHVDKAKTCLPSFHVDTWQGFVFVNLDREAGALRDYLDPIREVAERYDLENYVRAFKVRILMPCNWKLCQAAFFESYHFPWTHPQGNYRPEQDATGYVPRGRHGQFIVEFDEQAEDDPRRAQDMKLQRRLGHMQIFPNLQASNFFYSQWLPNGDDPDSCFMESSILVRVPAGAERPMDAPGCEVDGNDAAQVAQAWGEFAAFAEASNQDVSNLRTIQQGLKSRFYPGVTLSLYQESLIRHHLEVVDEYLAGP